jgi:hypothetical protein
MVKENKLELINPAVKSIVRETGVVSTALFLIVISKASIAVISILGNILIICYAILDMRLIR